MTNRDQLIADAYHGFRGIRTRPRHEVARELCGQTVNIVLRSHGQADLDGDEWRLLLATCDCGWADWPDSGQPEPTRPGADAFDQLPDATKMPSPNPTKGSAAAVTGRCTLWD